jgi:hypothetical protein
MNLYLIGARSPPQAHSPGLTRTRPTTPTAAPTGHP